MLKQRVSSLCRKHTSLHSVQRRGIINPIKQVITDYLVNQRQNGYDQEEGDDEKKCPHVFKLVPLYDQSRNDHTTRECTIYIKGFLSSHTNKSLTFPFLNQVVNRKTESEQATLDKSHFQFWKTSHHILVQRQSHLWSENVYGWEWPNGRFPHQFNFSKKQKEDLESHHIHVDDVRIQTQFNPLSYIPVPVTTLTTICYQIANVLYKRSFRVTPTLFLASLLNDVALTAVSGYLEFQQANKNALEYSHLFTTQLSELRNKYDYVRVVAHSLGAKHAIEAIKQLPKEERPDEVHLCAAAVSEKSVQEIFLEGLTNAKSNGEKRTYHYWNENDYLLSYIFRTITMGEVAIGSSELLGSYKSIMSLNVPIEHFPKVYGQPIVHNMYGNVFYKFAQ